MKIVIVGGGNVGGKIAESLAKENHDVVVVDKNPKAVAAIGSTEDIMCIVGSAVEKETMLEAGIKEADVLITCTDSDEVNMITSLLGTKNGAKRAVARVRNPEYLNQITEIKEHMGISLILNPERLAANTIARVLLFPAAESLQTLAHGKVELMEFVLGEGNSLIGKTLLEIGSSVKSKALISIIERDGEVIIPNGATQLEEGDHIYITADHKNMVSFFKKIDAFKVGVKSVIIDGGSRISYYLAKRLLDNGITVKIIEKDLSRCETLAELLPNALIVHADGTEEEVMLEEGLEQTDAFVALTDIDEVNAIISLFAKKHNVKKVVTKATQNVSYDMLKTIGVGTVVNPKMVIASQILRYVRAIHAGERSDSIDMLLRLADDKALAIGFIINEKAPYLGVPLRDLSLKDGNLIACIVRKNQVIIPGGEDEIKIGDYVIVITKSLNMLSFEEAIG